MQRNATIDIATEAAFNEAIRTNASAPRPNPALPHRIESYPVLAVRRHQEGDVILKVLVLANGQVGDVAVLKSSGFAQLDAAALVGVGGWYYVPAVRGHRPIAVWAKVLVHFAIAPG